MCKYKYGFQSSFLNQNVPSEEWQMLPAQIEGMNIGWKISEMEWWNI